MSDSEVKSTLAKSTYHDVWTRIYRGSDHEAYYRYAFDLAARFYEGTASGPVLDAGCGTGNHIRHLTQRGLDVCGIDYATEAVERTRANLAEIRGDRAVELATADILNLPFPDGRFTRVLCWGVLMHIPSVEQAICELCRVTAPGGRLVIGELNQASLQMKLARLGRTLLRRPARGDYVVTPAGVETWDGPPGARLVARRADIRWLQKAFGRHGARCVGIRSGELTEIYAEINSAFGRRMVHAINRVWYRWIRWPGPAAGNILLFEKSRGG
jgi:ubiquinone/menaquinone biosynthesis C-methylase UbiE